MKLGDIVEPKAVVPQLEATERDAVITELVDALVNSGAVDSSLRDELIELVKVIYSFHQHLKFFFLV